MIAQCAKGERNTENQTVAEKMRAGDEVRAWTQKHEAAAGSMAMQKTSRGTGPADGCSACTVAPSCNAMIELSMEPGESFQCWNWLIKVYEKWMNERKQKREDGFTRTTKA